VVVGDGANTIVAAEGADTIAGGEGDQRRPTKRGGSRGDFGLHGPTA
jgi:hypothetical protein